MSAQTFDEYKRQALENFSSYKSDAQRRFSEYRAKANAEYVEFIRQAWERYESERAVLKPEAEPYVPPVVLPQLEDDIDIPDEEIDVPEIDFGNLDDRSRLPVLPIPAPTQTPNRASVCFVFYGTDCSVGFDVKDKVFLNGSDEDAVADMWEALSSLSYDNVLSDCIAIRDRLELCDWGYYMLVRKLSEEIYGKRDEAAVLTAYVMSNSGYRLKLARLNSGSICLLVSTVDGIYNYPRVKVNGEYFYILDSADCKSLRVMKNDFPNTTALNLSICRQQNFKYSPSQERTLKSRAYSNVRVTVKINRNLMNFYDNYPCPYRKDEPGTSWVYYANAPLDPSVTAVLYPLLRASVSGKSQKDAANILINFVQTAFEYKTDGDYWGYERPLFPEETLFYPYSDCEDRAILFSRLVRDIMGLEVVFLSYEGHLATAVAFDEDISGDHIKVRGRKYLVCDPTYINAPIGMAMPNLTLKKVVKL